MGLIQGCVIFPRFFDVYIDSMVRDVNARGWGKGLALLRANGYLRFEINQLLFADDTARVGD